ncbi:MAG: hypothetical protein AAGD33_21870 [Actinomycetota bacterium]
MAFTPPRQRPERRRQFLPDESAGDVGWVGVAHSVVTTSLVDEDGELTAAVRDEIIEFFAASLEATA